jgi:DNA (cytosine-5)-methyltransferase 1
VTRFVDSLSALQLERLDALRNRRALTWRTAYRRTRGGVAVWEIRPDAVAGCLRTARGGSSKQAVVEAGGGDLRVRWMTASEYAALQGAADHSFSSVSENKARFGFGVAVCVPVISWIASHYLVPLCAGRAETAA